MNRDAFKAAFPYTIPILVGFLFMGMSYGFLMNSMGFPFYYPMLISLFVLGGSIQFVSVNLLISAFDPLQTFFIAVLVNARHLFYGLSMLEKYHAPFLKKMYLIFGMCDETFSINSTVTPPEGIDKTSFRLYVTMLNHSYWVLGSTLGGLLGYILKFDTKGIDFVMTALFVVMFIEQWKGNPNHAPALIGLATSLLCLFIFGSQNFMVPTMIAIMASFTFLYRMKIKNAERRG